MALQIQANTNDGLIKKLQDCGVIKHQIVANVMKETDRKHYSNLFIPYVDRLELIDANAYLAAPHMHAYALEKLVDFIKADSKILDIGSGSGYMAACFARLIQVRAVETLKESTGYVVGVEPLLKLVEFSIENITADNPKLIENGLIKIMEGDGRKGFEDYGPFDVIHVGAAIPEIPTELLMQLSLNGRMLCPVGDTEGVQQMIQCDRDIAGEITKKVLTNVTFDPLVDPLDMQPTTESNDVNMSDGTNGIYRTRTRTTSSGINEPQFSFKDEI
uniref:protein-L-isoaspartate(D-aspartate) O-methyltransferase n=1 Tax=Polypedilum vanderplanki TaxID=319348 RepID=S6B7T5_POLVA|nr:protein L-isoaspartyl methyltransferase [Polypedilum vanderplanki]